MLVYIYLRMKWFRSVGSSSMCETLKFSLPNIFIWIKQLIKESYSSISIGFVLNISLSTILLSNWLKINKRCGCQRKTDITNKCYTCTARASNFQTSIIISILDTCLFIQCTLHTSIFINNISINIFGSQKFARQIFDAVQYFILSLNQLPCFWHYQFWLSCFRHFHFW